MNELFNIAARVSTPLALSGLFGAILFFLFRQIVARNIFPQLTRALGADILRLIIHYLFWLTLVSMVLGFIGFILTRFSSPASTSEISPPPASYSAKLQIADLIGEKEEESALAAIRERHGVRGLMPLETGKPIHAAPVGTYFFVHGPYVNLERRLSASIESSFSGEILGTRDLEWADFEIHRLSDGTFGLIGFLTDEGAANVSGVGGGAPHSVMISPRAILPFMTIIILPLSRIESSKGRSIELPDQRVYILDAVLR